MAKQNKPDIRFKGFTDAWEQRKLGEFFEKYQNTVYLQDEEEYRQISIRNTGVVEYRCTNKGKNIGRKRQYLIDTDTHPVTLTFTRQTVYEGGIGFVPKELNGAIVTENMPLLEMTNASQDFMKALFNTSGYYKSVINDDTLIGSAQKALHEKQWLDSYVCIPVLDEQKQIGSFFQQLEHLITLHQRKYDKLQVLKKAMLEKMFPKNGSSVPEIRFKGFTDAWEQRKLGDNIVEYTEVTTENNQYPPLTSSRKGIFLQTEYFAGNQIASDDNTGYNIVPYGYFTYRHMSDDEVFHFNINDIVEKGIVSTLYPVFTTDENLDSRYLQYQLNYGHEFAKFAILQKQGGSRTYMYLNKLRQLHLTMPNHVEEQKAISSFFMNLDHLITLHQRELEKLQNIKKSMLEKMFV